MYKEGSLQKAPRPNEVLLTKFSLWVAVISAKKHKRQRRKRQSLNANEKSRKRQSS